MFTPKSFAALIASLALAATLAPAVDARRGVKPEDLEVIDWVDPVRRRVHVLLSKADKLNQAEKAQCLREARAALVGRATAQIFSAHSGLGVPEAQEQLASLWEPPGGA